MVVVVVVVVVVEEDDDLECVALHVTCDFHISRCDVLAASL